MFQFDPAGFAFFSFVFLYEIQISRRDQREPRALHYVADFKGTKSSVENDETN